MTVDNVNVQLGLVKQSRPHPSPHGGSGQVGVGRVEPAHLTLGLVVDLDTAILDSLITVTLDSCSVHLPYFRVAPDGLAKIKVRILNKT